MNRRDVRRPGLSHDPGGRAAAVGGDVRLAFLLCERCLPPWYINHIPIDRPPWTVADWRAGDRFRCPGCQAAVSRQVHSPTWRPFPRTGRKMAKASRRSTVRDRAAREMFLRYHVRCAHRLDPTTPKQLPHFWHIVEAGSRWLGRGSAHCECARISAEEARAWTMNSSR
jgi:hypothetical protein